MTGCATCEDCRTELDLRLLLALGEAGSAVARLAQEVAELTLRTETAENTAAELRHRYEVPLYPSVPDDRLVQALLVMTRSSHADQRSIGTKLLPLAEESLGRRRRLASLLAASASKATT